jgi:hypothetical protein
MTLHPSVKAVTFNCLKSRYGTPKFQDALVDFIAQANYPRARGNTMHKYAEDTLIPFCYVLVFHIIKFTDAKNADETKTIDSVLAWPKRKNRHRQIIPSCFDMVLVQNPSQDTTHG